MKFLFTSIFVFATIFFAKAIGPTDTLRLTLPEAEQLFVSKNFNLLAAHFQIDAANAAIEQAKLGINPTVFVEHNAYNTIDREALDVQKNGESIVQIQQLLLLAHKRRKQIDLASQLALAQQYSFDDLVRQLRYQLRTAFFDLFYQEKALKMYDGQISSFQNVLSAYQDQLTKGNISLKEVIRLRAFLADLKNERGERLNEITDQENDLKTLLAAAPQVVILPIFEEKTLQKGSVEAHSLADLLSAAQQSRPDLKFQNAQIRASESNLALQKALAVPDLSVGLNYDRNGSAYRNYVGLQAGIALPFFNRNQGNIEAAKAQISTAQQSAAGTWNAIQLSIEQAYAKALENERLTDESSRSFVADFDKFMENVDENYRKRNLSLLEYLDFYDSHKESLLQFNKLSSDRRQFLEDLNLAVGQTIYP